MSISRMYRVRMEPQRFTFKPHDDVIDFANQCKTAIDNDTKETIRMNRLTEYGRYGSEISMVYDTKSRDKFMVIIFKYRATLTKFDIMHMMEENLMWHQDLFMYMRRYCNIERIYVHQFPDTDQFVIMTRRMEAKFLAKNFKIFRGRHGWGNIDWNPNMQIYQPTAFDPDGMPATVIHYQPRAPHPRGCRCRICHRA